MHPDHFGKMSNFLGPEDVILVGAGDPAESVIQDVLQSSHYGGKVRYFKGSIMSQKDLHNMALRNASAVFLLSDLHSSDPKGEDAKTVVSALILRDFDANAKIFAEVRINDLLLVFVCLCYYVSSHCVVGALVLALYTTGTWKRSSPAFISIGQTQCCCLH